MGRSWCEMPPKRAWHTIPNRQFDSPEYTKWRKDVRKRDKAKCQFPACQSRIKIQCHHIQKYADNPLLRFATNNGICLCKEHHDFIRGKEEIYAPLFMNIVQANTRTQLEALAKIKPKPIPRHYNKTDHPRWKK